MKQLTIYLGSRCNLACAYCHRKADAKEPQVSAELLSRIKDGDGLTIKFMGGEPTLYMADIKQIVEVAPCAHYAICTNGVELEKHLPFFRKHKFLVCISYDGDEGNKRGFDPFTKVIDYPYLAVSTTIYHGNTDFKEILRRFAEKERIIGRPLSFFPHFAHATESNDYSLTKEDADSVLSQYKEYVGGYMKERFNYGVRNLRFEGMFTGLLRRYEADFGYGETYCVNSRVKKCDAGGRLFTCLYMRDDELTSENWQAEQRRILDARFPECRDCQVYFMCGGGCVKSKSRDIECYINKRLFSWFKTGYEKGRKQC